MTRDIAPGEWGKAILEDILFRAAKAASDQPPGTPPAPVSLTFTLTPDAAAGDLVISTPGAVEELLVTRLPVRGQP